MEALYCGDAYSRPLATWISGSQQEMGANIQLQRHRKKSNNIAVVHFFPGLGIIRLVRQKKLVH
jgi:hypothetical protein